MEIYSVIAGSGCYIPECKIPNNLFLNHTFFETDGKRIEKSNAEIISKFEEITGIKERRHMNDDQVTSDMAYLAAKDALISSNTDPETLDYIILAHNFGDIRKGGIRSEMVPSLASKVKYHLQIKNPSTISYDVLFGCAGWLQGILQADYYIRSGSANRVMVIGSEALSRITDPYDRDCMIFADGAGAVILEGKRSEAPVGITAHHTQTYAGDLTYVLRLSRSNNPDYCADNLFLKMYGRTLYEYALKFVPDVIKTAIEKARLSIEDIDKLFIHQANNKMDEAILKRLFTSYGYKEPRDNIMPMTISWLGNSSVATLPTLYDLVSKGSMKNHKLNKGKNIAFASVGAGININAFIYKIPD